MRAVRAAVKAAGHTDLEGSVWNCARPALLAQSGLFVCSSTAADYA